MKRVAIVLAVVLALTAVPYVASAQGLPGLPSLNGWFGGAFDYGNEEAPGLCKSLDFYFHGGARYFYPFSEIVYDDKERGVSLNFQDVLGFADNLSVFEMFMGFPLSDQDLFTGSLVYSVRDRGEGILPFNVKLGDTVYAAGSYLQAEVATWSLRGEFEHYTPWKYNMAVGPYFFIEYYRAEYDFTGTSTAGVAYRDQGKYDVPFGGIGAVIKMAPTEDVYLGAKAAYLPIANGIHLDVKAQLDPPVGGKAMQLTVGWRYRNFDYSDDDYDVSGLVQGPYAEVGWAF